MGWENIKSLLSKLDINSNNIIEQTEIDSFKKANPTIPLNGVKAGMTVGDSMEGLVLEKTTTSLTQPEEKKPTDIFKKEKFAPYENYSSIYKKIKDISELRKNSQGVPFTSWSDLSGLNLTKEQFAGIVIDNMSTILSEEQQRICKELDPDFIYDPQLPEPEITKIKNFTEIPTGSHPDIKDARNCDISELKLSKEELLDLCIDNTTVLSDEQKKIVDEYKEKMKDPGLGIRNLHSQGITGKGITIAIIDQPLGEHREYSSNLVHLENINTKEMNCTNAEMHGAAVASIAVGKTTGVAPDSDLVYFGAINRTNSPENIEEYKNNLLKAIENNKDDTEFVQLLEEQIQALEKTGEAFDNTPYANAINKILDMNKNLPSDKKIPVISISWGFDKYAPGYDKLLAAVERAKKEGVFVVSTALKEQYGMETNGANRNPVTDPNNPEGYEAGAFWLKKSESGNIYRNKDKLLLVPMDHRTVADYHSKDGYRYEGNDGGMSWSTPWLAGMYALAKQVNPQISPQEFWEKALETSDECKNNNTGVYVGRLINPQKLIESIKNNK